MVSVDQMTRLGIGVRDVNQWESFAREILGLQAYGRDDDGTLFLRMDEYHHRFAMHPNGNDDLNYIGWEVPTEQALKELTEPLRANGVAVTQGTVEEAKKRRVLGMIKFQDPSGIPQEAYYGVLSLFDQPFHSPRPISGFVTGEQGFGHVVVAVDDFQKSIQFYRAGLGMRISDFITFQMGSMEVEAAFFHCNPRHHTIAFGQFGPTPPPKRLNHFMLQLKSIDDVGVTMYLCQDMKVPISSTLGRHTNDHMLSFYLTTPSGFDVEYGWGARTVDDSTWRVVSHTSASIWGHR